MGQPPNLPTIANMLYPNQPPLDLMRLPPLLFVESLTPHLVPSYARKSSNEAGLDQIGSAGLYIFHLLRHFNIRYIWLDILANRNLLFLMRRYAVFRNLLWIWLGGPLPLDNIELKLQQLGWGGHTFLPYPESFILGRFSIHFWFRFFYSLNPWPLWTSNYCFDKL